MNVDNAAHLSLSLTSSTPVLHGVFLAWSDGVNHGFYVRSAA